MVSYCVDCGKYVNQYCERCFSNIGIEFCERYSCHGRMICPICGGNNLLIKKEENTYPFWVGIHEGDLLGKKVKM